MSDNKILNQNEIIDSVIEKIKSNDFNIYFYCPPMNGPSGGVGVLLRLAKHLKDENYNVKIIYEPRVDQKASYEKSIKLNKQVNVYETFKPNWVEFSIEDIPFIPLGDKTITFNDGTSTLAQNLKLSGEDYLFIPEGFPDIMKKTMNTSCKRIVLAQSWFYILNALGHERWQDFGISDVVAISDSIIEYLNAVMPGLNIRKLNQGIDRETFKVPEKKTNKYPMVGYLSTRGPENRLKVMNIIKMFQRLYPHLRFIRFIDLQSNTREEFAEKISQTSINLVTDPIAGFGTSPLESMACGSHVVGWSAFGMKEFANFNGSESNGFWVQNEDIFQAAEMLGVALDKLLLGDLDAPEIQETYEKTLAKYTVEGEKKEFLDLINYYKNIRINELESVKQ